MKLELNHARHAPTHCHAPGLFRSLAPGERKKLKLEVIYKIDDKRQIEFSGPEPLGVDDLRVLQGLVAMAGPGGLRLGPAPQTDSGVAVREKLELRWDAINDDALLVKGSFNELARVIGFAGASGRHLEHMRNCIERLWKCSIIVQDGKTRRGFRLLADYASDGRGGELYVALNPLISSAINGGSHTRIDMTEVRALKSDPARLLHQRLSAIISTNKKTPVRFCLDTLCGYIWPAAANDEAMKKRRCATRNALAELARLEWHIAEYAKGKFEICRP